MLCFQSALQPSTSGRLCDSHAPAQAPLCPRRGRGQRSGVLPGVGRPSVAARGKRRGSAEMTSPSPAPGRAPAELVDTSPVMLEAGAPPVPRPGPLQQTLQRSFTLGGIGLHSGEYATVRVRPACANEGRYFVRVPEGTNKERFKMEEGLHMKLEEAHGPMDYDPNLEESKLQVYQAYLTACDEEGFGGTFTDFLHDIDKQELLEAVRRDPHYMANKWEEDNSELEVEAIQPRGSGEDVVAAHVDAVPDAPQAVALSLGAEVGEPGAIIGAEQLLATLECCGVDNARIEIEGGREVPVLDGSALGWALEVQFAGTRLAPEASALVGGRVDEQQPFRPTERLVARPEQVITVRQEDGFISLMPEDTMRQTVGIDCAANAPVIGKQWLSWCMYEDGPFGTEVAPARRYMESVDEVLALHSMGWLQGGTEGVMLVGFKDRWYDAMLPRFVRDEPVRQEMCSLLGLLALSAKPGHAGIPVGHVVQYKATLELQLQFVRELRERLTEDDYVPVQLDGEEEGSQEDE